MDICDRVSKLMECGNDNSPVAVNGIMKNLQNSMGNVRNETFLNAVSKQSV
jgi:hypothetical protein